MEGSYHKLSDSTLAKAVSFKHGLSIQAHPTRNRRRCGRICRRLRSCQLEACRLSTSCMQMDHIVARLPKISAALLRE